MFTGMVLSGSLRSGKSPKLIHSVDAQMLDKPDARACPCCSGISRMTQARTPGLEKAHRMKAGMRGGRATRPRPHYSRDFPGPTSIGVRTLRVAI